MRKGIMALLFLGLCPLFTAQQAMNNDAIIKLAKAGLSDDVIISTINSSAGSYDTSADALVNLKSSGVDDKVITAIKRLTHMCVRCTISTWTFLQHFRRPSLTSPILRMHFRPLSSFAGRVARLLALVAMGRNTRSSRLAASGFATTARSSSPSRWAPSWKTRRWALTSG